MRWEKLVELAILCLIEVILNQNADLTLDLWRCHTAAPLSIP
jgi:hypothetical protein